MAFKLPSRVLETTISEGTGALTLAGAVTRHVAFADRLSNGDTTHYRIEGGSDYEIGFGTYSAGTLTRTTVLRSSNADAAVNWLNGEKLVGIVPIGPSDLDATNLGRLLGALSFSPFVQTLINDPSAAAFLATLGVSAFVQTLLDDADAAGALATLGIVAGTYTPTGTPVTNVDSLTMEEAMYVRVGSLGFVAGYCNVNPTAASGTSGTMTVFGISLPVASNFTSAADAAGVDGSHASGPNVGFIMADATNDRAQAGFRAYQTVDTPLSYIFGYRIK